MIKPDVRGQAPLHNAPGVVSCANTPKATRKPWGGRFALIHGRQDNGIGQWHREVNMENTHR